jgi:hypothetical protein
MAAQMDSGNLQRPNRWRPIVWGLPVALLLVPAVAMQLEAPGVDWGPVDFLIMGTLLFGCAGFYELATRMSGSTAYRAGFALCILMGFLQIWINLAVGIVDEPHEQWSLLFFAVPLIGAFGAAIGRFKPQGLVRAAYAAGLMQAVAGIAPAVFGPIQGVILATAFVVGWLVAAQLFRMSARAPRLAGARDGGHELDRRL